MKKLVLLTAFAALAVVGQNKTNERLVKNVRHELVMLPYYSVYDNLAYRVDGSKVSLFGQVQRPTLKKDAENVVKRIEGVDSVVNEIEVLPNSPNDDRLREALFRAIYGKAQLNRYALMAVPPIHIIVKNGNVTLVGWVASEGDKTVADLAAKGVPNVFSVKIELGVEK
jgi:hyperosmotically inducible protein